MSLTFLMSPGHLIHRLYFSLVLSTVFSWLGWGSTFFGKNITQVIHPQPTKPRHGVHDVNVFNNYSFIINLSVDYSGACWFSLYKINFHFERESCLGKTIWDYADVPFLLKGLPILVFIDGPCLQQLVLWSNVELTFKNVNNKIFIRLFVFVLKFLATSRQFFKYFLHCKYWYYLNYIFSW